MLGVPPAIVGVGVVMGGVYWFTKRRDRIQAEKSSQREAVVQAEQRPEVSEGKEERDDN